jgi:hypothetical protein
MKLFKPTARKFKLKIRPGIGLIETIVAMSILVSAIVALMSMVISSATARSANEYMTVAGDLAREGVEVVVAKRNDNWINDLPFDTGMYVGTDYTFELSFNPATSGWSFDNTPNLITDATAVMYKYTAAAVSPAIPGLMVQASVQPPNTAASQYRRLVTIDSICLDETIVTSGSSCSAANYKIGVRITSTVQWVDHTYNHNLSIIETVYDWR